MAPLIQKCPDQMHVGHPYGENFLYDEMFSVAGMTVKSRELISVITHYLAIMFQNLEGPSKESRDSGATTCYLPELSW